MVVGYAVFRKARHKVGCRCLQTEAVGVVALASGVRAALSADPGLVLRDACPLRLLSPRLGTMVVAVFVVVAVAQLVTKDRFVGVTLGLSVA